MNFWKSVQLVAAKWDKVKLSFDRLEWIGLIVIGISFGFIAFVLWYAFSLYGL